MTVAFLVLAAAGVMVIIAVLLGGWGPNVTEEYAITLRDIPRLKRWYRYLFPKPFLCPRCNKVYHRLREQFPVFGRLCCPNCYHQLAVLFSSAESLAADKRAQAVEQQLREQFTFQAPAYNLVYGSPTIQREDAMTDINNRTDFAAALLDKLSIPPNGGNEIAIVAWATKEGGHWANDAKFNPLNTTWKMPDSSSIPNNPAGVQAYTSWDEGIQATFDTVELNYYDAVRASLRGSDPYAVSQAVAASPWGTGEFAEYIEGARAEVARDRGTGTNPPPATPTAPPPDAPAFPGRLLKQPPVVNSGECHDWQTQMHARGWAIQVDGYYGPKSEAVCRAFQAEKGLHVDGIVGPDTWRASWTAPITRP